MSAAFSKVRLVCEGASPRSLCHGLGRRVNNLIPPVNPLIRFALAHAEQASLHHLERVSLYIGQNKQKPVLWGRQGAVLIHAKLAGGPRFPIEAPGRHMGLEGRLKGRDQLLKFVKGHQLREDVGPSVL